MSTVGSCFVICLTTLSSFFLSYRYGASRVLSCLVPYLISCFLPFELSSCLVSLSYLASLLVSCTVLCLVLSCALSVSRVSRLIVLCLRSYRVSRCVLFFLCRYSYLVCRISYTAFREPRVSYGACRLLYCLPSVILCLTVLLWYSCGIFIANFVSLCAFVHFDVFRFQSFHKVYCFGVCFLLYSSYGQMKLLYLDN